MFANKDLSLKEGGARDQMISKLKFHISIATRFWTRIKTSPSGRGKTQSFWSLANQNSIRHWTTAARAGAKMKCRAWLQFSLTFFISMAYKEWNKILPKISCSWYTHYLSRFNLKKGSPTFVENSFFWSGTQQLPRFYFNRMWKYITRYGVSLWQLASIWHRWDEWYSTSYLRMTHIPSCKRTVRTRRLVQKWKYISIFKAQHLSFSWTLQLHQNSTNSTLGPAGYNKKVFSM